MSFKDLKFKDIEKKKYEEDWRVNDIKIPTEKDFMKLSFALQLLRFIWVILFITLTSVILVLAFNKILYLWMPIIEIGAIFAHFKIMKYTKRSLYEVNMEMRKNF